MRLTEAEVNAIDPSYDYLLWQGREFKCYPGQPDKEEYYTAITALVKAEEALEAEREALTEGRSLDRQGQRQHQRKLQRLTMKIAKLRAELSTVLMPE